MPHVVLPRISDNMLNARQGLNLNGSAPFSRLHSSVAAVNHQVAINLQTNKHLFAEVSFFDSWIRSEFLREPLHNYSAGLKNIRAVGVAQRRVRVLFD